MDKDDIVAPSPKMAKYAHGISGVNLALSEPEVEEVPLSQELTEIEKYIHQLRMEHAVVVCDESLKNFILQEYSVKDHYLKSNTFVSVSRCAKKFAGLVSWIYWCSCDRVRSEFVQSINSSVDSSLSDIDKLYGECLHIQALEEIGRQDLDIEDSIINAITADDDFRALPDKDLETESYDEPVMLPIGTQGAVCVVSSDTSQFGVVYCNRRKLVVCALCKLRQCLHTEHVAEALNNEHPPTVLDKIVQQMKCTPKAISANSPRISIPFNSTTNFKRVFSSDIVGRLNIVDGNAHLKPDLQTSCASCGHIRWSESEETSDVWVVTINQLIKGTRYSRRCVQSGCDGILVFDGHKDAVLSICSHCITYEVLRSVMHQFLTGSTTILCQYRVLCKQHEDTGSDLSKSLTYKVYLKAWHRFIESLDIDYAPAYSCGVCGDQPDTIIMDATSVSFRRTLQTIDHSDKLCQGDAARLNDGVLVNNRVARMLLNDFTRNGITYVDFKTLEKQLKNYCTSLPAVLNLACSSEGEPQSQTTAKCKPAWKNLIRSIAAESPISGLICPSQATQGLIHALSDTDVTHCVAIMNSLHKEMPVVYRLVSTLGTCPKELYALLSELFVKTGKLFAARLQASLVSTSSSYQQHAHNYSFFPSLPKVRSRRQYHVDQVTNGLICYRKQMQPAITSGVFGLYCPHGICYGVEVIRRETCNTPFTILYERFQTAPSTIIYDNGCNFHRYIMNREPIFFKNSRVLVDRFHWSNHTNCSAGYNMDYPQYVNINSQVAEQANAALKRIKPALASMNADHFVRHITFYLWHRNTLLKKTCDSTDM